MRNSCIKMNLWEKEQTIQCTLHSVHFLMKNMIVNGKMVNDYKLIN